jgi:hypothetical protein
MGIAQPEWQVSQVHRMEQARAARLVFMSSINTLLTCPMAQIPRSSHLTKPFVPLIVFVASTG